MPKKITLTQGRHALVDDEDYDRLSQFKWAVNSMGYAQRTVTLVPSMIDGRRNRKSIKMHHEFLKPTETLVVDHINRNKLDNRRSNLRLVTQRDNIMNSSRAYKNEHRGVYIDNSKNRYRAFARIGGKWQHLGYFRDIKDAISARLAWELKNNYKGTI